MNKLALFAGITGALALPPLPARPAGTCKSRMSKKEWEKRQVRKRMSRKSKQRNRR